MYQRRSKKILEGFSLNKKFYEELTKDLSELNKKIETPNIDINTYNSIKYEIETLDKECHRVKNEIDFIEDVINSLEQPSKNILYYKFVKKLPHLDIAIRMNYSIQRIYQLYNLALNEFLVKYDEHKHIIWILEKIRVF